MPRGKPGAPAPASPPLLLMFDGQNIFDDGPSFAGGWHLHAAVERRARSRRRAVAPVVLGLEHGGVLRMRELNPFAPDGRLDAQLDWIEGTLLPDVRARLGRALCEVWVGGASMGCRTGGGSFGASGSGSTSASSTTSGSATTSMLGVDWGTSSRCAAS